MGDTIGVTCQVCGPVGAIDYGDGYLYCGQCGSQAEDIIDTALDNEDYGIYTGNALRRRLPTTIKVEQHSLREPRSQFWESPKIHDGDQNHGLNPVKVEDWVDGIGPTEPWDFGQRPLLDNEEDHLRMIYVMGLETMVQLQTKALVEEFNVSPLICGLAGTIWLRYVASSGIFEDHWANEVIKESESQKEGFREDFSPKHKHSGESFNIHGQRAIMLWYRSLSNIIPLSHTLVITYLVCHLAREAVLPTDILRWSLEGKLPYFTAFIDIEKQSGTPSASSPLSFSFMFKPSESISLYKLESQAASLARELGLELPPVNFYAIASRYLKRLELDSAEILPSICQLHEWSMPPDLWLSANEMRLPTRVCVLSMVIVAIRILYNIHGFGFWEKSFSGELSTENSSKKSSDIEKSEQEAMELLRHLEERYNELEEKYEYTKDLPTYLQYCKDVVFAGMQPSYEDLEEEKLIEQFWNYYQDKKNSNIDCKCIKRSRDDDVMNSTKESKRMRDNGNKSSHGENSSQANTSDGVSEKDRAMERLMLDMEDNRVCYIPPRVKVKRRDYLQYVRKKDDGAYTYAAHADYYILLRSCARVAKVDIRVMHYGVMSFERRLGWLEKRIDYSLSQLGHEVEFCEHCREEMENHVRGGSVGVSK